MLIRTTLSALLVVGLTACGGSAAAVATPAPVNLAGQVVQVTGSTLTVADNQSRDTNVLFDNATTIESSAAATVADVVAGSCVTGSGSADANGVIAVRMLQVSPSAGGKCPAAAATAPGRGARPSPTAGASPNPARPPGGVANLRQVAGLVTGSDGTTVKVKSSSGVDLQVTLGAAARITRLVAYPATDLKVGACIQATGTTLPAGLDRAALIIVSQPGTRGCFAGGPGGFGQRGGPSPSPTPTT
jgi:hypothetical protein